MVHEQEVISDLFFQGQTDQNKSAHNNAHYRINSNRAINKKKRAQEQT